MSGLITFLIIVSIIGRIFGSVKKARQKQHQQQWEQARRHRADAEDAMDAKEKQQTAHEWIFGTQQTRPADEDPEGRTLEYADMPDEDDLQPVRPSVVMDLTDIHESAHDIVHESVHETVRVRKQRSAEPAEAKAPTLQLNPSMLAQALLLSEALGEPRAKRPWQPNRRS